MAAGLVSFVATGFILEARETLVTLLEITIQAPAEAGRRILHKCGIDGG